MIWLNVVSGFIKAMRAGQTPNQIAAGFGLGYMIGLMPFMTLQGIFLFILLFLFNINLAAGSLAIVICSLFAYLLDPVFHHLGYLVLAEIPALQGTWEWLYNLPVAPLTRFNNTVVMGSFLVGLITVVPVYFGMKKFVVVYRTRLEDRIKKWKVVKFIQGSKLYQLYEKYRDIGG